MKNSKIRKFATYLFIATLVVTNFSLLPVPAQAACVVNSATFNPSGQQPDGWYQGSNSPGVQIQVATTGCVGTSFEMSITERDSVVGETDDDISEFDNKKIDVPSDNFSINFRAGETECERNVTNDCEYYITIYGAVTWDTQNKPGGELKYECDGSDSILFLKCGDSWKYLGITPEGVTLPGTDPSINTDTTYTPLAPLPFLETFDSTQNCAFGNYLDTMIKIFIGVAAVLAMVMIVLGGLEYMTSELLSSKEHGRERIRNAILGLLIALGAFAILNTINPKLLEKCLTLPKATIVFEPDEPPTIVAGTKNTIGSTSASCPGGLVSLSSTGVTIKSGSESQLICKNMIPTLKTLQSKVGNWYVTAAIDPGNHESRCHDANKQESGNCFDIGIPNQGNYGAGIPNNNPNWGEICKALNSISGINFANEASSNPNCGGPKTYLYTNGANIHVNRVN